MQMTKLLQLVNEKGASDLFITAGIPPSLKVDGEVLPIKDAEVLTSKESGNLAYSVMSDEQRRDFENNKECNFAIHQKKSGRFRVNVFMQKGSVGMVCRTITTIIPSVEELRLPEILKKLAMTKRGLIVFVGGTGTGKSTSMASLIQYRNHRSRDHIVTIEDPIEFLHAHDKSIITQREVGVDTDSFESALVNAMRQAPDLIQIGEIRTRETMESALILAETGHLCMATLHANNTYQALDRIINFFPDDRRTQLLMDLSMNLHAIVSQRLLAIKGKSGRIPAVEVLINSPLVAELIKEGRVDELREIIERSEEWGMQTFDQSLFGLYEADLISYEDAMTAAESENELRLRIKLQGKDVDAEQLGESLSDVTFDDSQ
ncbi:MAG: PilT/PilU family type 4a pilus ATPase [Proteobacteria bacterium]|jgi:twitching motility protein PilU|nr:PilT/PilU family type 4a pilus ATPase [Pseudomonadota bacterium]